MKNSVYLLNSFAKIPSGGNPAGVVLEANDFTDVEMQKIAGLVGFSETAFIQQSDAADFKVRFFTPEGEVDLCGHATIATFSLLHQKGYLSPGQYAQETKAGVLALEIDHAGMVWMMQNNPQYTDRPEIAEILDCLQIPENYLIEGLPIQVVSTGLRDILVPIQSLEKLFAIQPDFDKVATISKKYDTIGIHMFTLETINGSTAHCRNLAPLYGIPEESATGTSNGALSCYLYHYKMLNDQQANRLIFEQGYCMKKPSEIQTKLVTKDMDIQEIWVGGSAEFAGAQQLG